VVVLVVRVVALSNFGIIICLGGNNMSLDDNSGYDSKYLRTGQSRSDAFMNGIEVANGDRIEYNIIPRSFEEVNDILKALRDYKKEI
jgi:hypothetical protein